MEDTTEIDLQELESKLYSQVFHSTENWEEANTQISTLIQQPNRQVSTFSINNSPAIANRYYNTKSAEQTEKTNQTSSENLTPKIRTNVLRYKSFIIPPTLELPSPRVRKLPADILEYFQLNTKDSIGRFRRFLIYLEKSGQIYSETKKLSPKITITTNGEDQLISLSDISISTADKSDEIQNDDIVVLSDSETDSVIEIPMPPVPVVNVDSSDSESATFKNTDKIDSVKKTPNKSKCEEERDEFLHTPDTNDFIENDVNILDNFRFNFNLHASDLDLNKFKENLSKDKEDLNQKTDVYETESTCSEMSNRPRFQEMQFENTINNDIFCEPDLSKFSNFITPKRKENIKSNTNFAIVKTKACVKDELIKKRSKCDNSDDSDGKSKKKRKKEKKKKKKKDCDELSNVPNDTNLENIQSVTKHSELNTLDKSPDKIDKNDKSNQIVENSDKTMETNKTNTKICTSVTEYYNDTYFADDLILIESDENVENGKQNSVANFSFVDTWRKSNQNQIHPNPLNPRNNSIGKDFDFVLNVSKEKEKLLKANDFSFVDTFEQTKKKYFKDYFTTDMDKFYDESWGQENFDVQKVQSSMTNDPSKWQIDPDDLMRISPKRRGPPCSRCKEYGHTYYRCTKIIEIKCSMCGLVGHSSNRCPNSICTTCRKSTNHYTTSCRNCSHYNSFICHLCKVVGHLNSNCPDLWRRYHLTTDSVEELKTSSETKPANKHWCSNCAQRGHFEDKCTYLRTQHFPVTSNIINYKPTYDEMAKKPPVLTQNIPMLNKTNITVTDIKNAKNKLEENNNRKFMTILRQLRKKCDKNDIMLLNRIKWLQFHMRNKPFNTKNIAELNRIRARVNFNKKII